MNLTDGLDLCDDGNVLSNKDRLHEIGKLLGVEAKTCNEIPNKGWNMEVNEMKGRKFMQTKQIFKEFSDKLSYLICPDDPTFNKHMDVQGTKVYQSLKENLTNLTFLGRKETSVTAEIITAKLFKLNYYRELMEEQFSNLIEEKSTYVS